jgi:hypothetical protein
MELGRVGDVGEELVERTQDAHAGLEGGHGISIRTVGRTGAAQNT